ncbi:RrF2 family transcriptional regulator [Belliella marina]|uniref:RrF2 family transcriptional regulator n=1 Tax=Belliella marina TaxID=1644146 RepID=A0ABW4VNK5_9BACT
MFSKACQYGIKAVIYIWTQSMKGNKVGAKEVAELVDAPEAFTAKILQELVRKKIIGSQKGPSGGFFVGKEHGKYTLKDLVTAIDGEGLFSGCSLGLKSCSDSNPCPLHHEISKVRAHVVSMLTIKTLKELAQEVESGVSVLSRLV